MSNFDVFDNGNAAVHDFASIAAYVNRKPQPASDISGVPVYTLDELIKDYEPCNSPLSVPKP